jgi:hypothetical protein
LQLFPEQKPHVLLRLRCDLLDCMRLKSGEEVRTIKAHLGRDASLFPVLDALHAAAQKGCYLRRTAELLDEVFVGWHLLFTVDLQ